MSIYSELLDRVSKGAKFKIDLVQKTLKIDGKEIVLEGKELISIQDKESLGKMFGYDLENCNNWFVFEYLYARYKRSVPSAHHNGNKPFFKAVPVEDLTDDEIAFNEPRNYCQAMLEGFVLLAGLSGWLEWKNENHWFWQGTDKELVVLKEWIQ